MMLLSQGLAQPGGMDRPFSFIRDNPFIKNDLFMRKLSLPNRLTHHRSNTCAKVPPSSDPPPSEFAVLRAPSSVENCQGTMKTEQLSMGNGNAFEDTEVDNLSTASDLEYGPGIVEKLKAKFHRLSGIVSRNAKVSQHTTGKRCTSVDDITPTAEEELQNGRIGKSGYSSAISSPLSRKHSQSTGDMLEDKRRLFTVHRTVEIGESDHPEVRIRPPATKLPDNNNDDELEFIKVGRRLRHNSPYLEKLGCHQENVHDVPQDVPVIPRNGSKKAVVYARRVGGMPILSSNARVTKGEFYKVSNLEIHAVDMQSPPDPDSARRRVSPNLSSSPVAFVRADDFRTNTGVSPPPEEPKPSQDFGVVNGGNDYLPKACLWEIRRPTVPQVTRPQIIPKNNNESGVIEMLRLLNKFQRLRDEQRSEQIGVVQTPEMTTSKHLHFREHPSDHSVVGIRSTHCSTSFRGYSQSPHQSLKANRTDIVNISVESSAQKFQSYQYDDENNVECGGTPSLTCSRSEQPRKSLSAKYVEEKLKASTVAYGKEEPIVSSIFTLPNPDVELSPESTKPFSPESTELISSSNREDESSNTNELDLSDLEKDIITGGGSPISRSLLSLVMEEDIPDFMEAVKENLTYEFEDLHDQTPPTSSILHSPETRRERRKARQVTSIRFEETEPRVYTYLDEMSAKVNKEWVEGVHVDYETYQSIIAAEVEEYKKNVAELQKWRESIAAQMPQDTSIHEDREFTVDVPSSFTYSPTHNENKTMCVRILYLTL